MENEESQEVLRKRILLIRNPVDAIRSWWNHKKDASEEPIDQDIDTPRFTRFVEAELDRWRDTALDWILLADHLLVVHYEDLLADPLIQVERIRTFLQLKEDKLRTKCVAKSTFTAFKRVKKQNASMRLNYSISSKIKHLVSEIKELLDYTESNSVSSVTNTNNLKVIKENKKE